MLDIPLFWNSPYGKVATQFKTFSYQQGRFIKNWVLGELRDGNVAPLITFLISSQVFGTPVVEGRTFLRGEKAREERREMSLVGKLATNQLTVAGFGLSGDFAFQAYRVAGGSPFASMGSFIIGPSQSDVIKLADAAARATGGNAKQIKQQLLQQLPSVGGVSPIPFTGTILKVLADYWTAILRDKED